MAKEIILPRQGNTVESCLIIEWKKNEGEKVKTGEVVCEVETDKAVFQLEAVADGTLLKTFFKAGDDVPVMTVIGVIGNPGEDVSKFAPKVSAEPEVQEKKEDGGNKEVQGKISMTQSVGNHGISPRARNLAGQKGVNADLIPGTGPSGRIIERDVVAAIPGNSMSPAAMDLVNKKKKSSPQTGSGIGGRILVSDLVDISEGVDSIINGEYRDIPVKGIRKVIATRMLQSMTGTAQCTLSSSAEATALLEGRGLIKKSDLSKGFSNITLNDFILFAVARTLMKNRYINSHFLGDSIREFGFVNLGFAVDTEKGLMVPVIKGADKLGLAELSKESKRLAASCVDETVKPDELTGATFTISNLGALGIESFTPVLNPPETGILGICSITQRPVSRDNKIVFAPVIGLSLTFNHQAVDGAPAARFLKAISEELTSLDIKKLLNV